jgi:Na+:H+ antiporter
MAELLETVWRQADPMSLFLVLSLGLLTGFFSERFWFPNAVAQVLLGVVLGAAVLGWVAHDPVIHVWGEIGVVVLLGVAGLEVGMGQLKDAGWPGIWVAVLGIVLSLVGGYAVALWYGSPADESIYLALALAATSIGISVQVLHQYGLMGHRVAEVIIAAAVVDDVIALYLLGAAHGFLSDGLSAPEIVTFVVLAVMVLVALFVLSKTATAWLAQRRLIERPGLRCAWILLMVALGASTTALLELSAVVGAFFAGVGTGEGLTQQARESSVKALNPLVLATIPFFFVMIGVQAEWTGLTDGPLLNLVLVLIAMACFTKVVGGVVGAWRVGRWRDRCLVGAGMMPRGEVALVIATIGFQQGHLSQPVYIAVIMMTIVVSVLGPLWMAPLAKRLANDVEHHPWAG